MKNVLFVSGCDRSGTTAFAETLNAHPSIALGIERFKYTIARDQESFKPELFEENSFFNISPDQTNIIRPEFYDNMKNKFANITVVGDKLPRYFQYFDLLEERFPQCKHIFIVREPVAVANSWQARANNPKDVNWPKTQDFRAAVRTWNLSLRCALEQMERRPDDMLVVSYDKFFRPASSEPDRIVDFLGIRSAPELDRAHEAATTAPRREKPLALTEDQVGFLRKSIDRNLAERVYDLAGETFQ